MIAIIAIATAIITAATLTRPPDRRPLRYWRHYRRAQHFTRSRELADVQSWLAAIADHRPALLTSSQGSPTLAGPPTLSGAAAGVQSVR